MTDYSENNIDRILELIAWNQPEEAQRRGIAMAREVKCIKAFFQPACHEYGKNVWDNCAVIIYRRSDEELKYYISDMLLWLEDLNWPGAERIQERLKQFREADILAMHLNHWVSALEKLGKTWWVSEIAEVLDNPNLKDYLKPETLQIMQARHR